MSRTAPGKVDAVVVDYFDHHPMLHASWRNRRIVYQGQSCAIDFGGGTGQAQRVSA